MFLHKCSTYEGTPARLYRSAGEIRRDMLDIQKKISEANERVNVRAMITELLNDSEAALDTETLRKLEELVFTAEKSLSELRLLCEALDLLREELKDTLCVMRL